MSGLTTFDDQHLLNVSVDVSEEAKRRTAEINRRARLAVCDRFDDVEEARFMLTILGLLPEPEVEEDQAEDEKPQPLQCKRCDKPMVRRREVRNGRDPEVGIYRARGLCNRCYQQVILLDLLDEYPPLAPPPHGPVDEDRFVEQVLQVEHLPPAIAAERLGYTVATIATRLYKYGRPDLAVRFNRFWKGGS